MAPVCVSIFSESGFGTFMAVLATGRPAFFLMTALALLVESILGGRGLGFDTMAAGALASFDTVVMAALAVSHLALVGSMVESNLAHFVGHFDFGRTVVGGDDHGADGEEGHGDENSDKTFHELNLQEIVTAHPSMMRYYPKRWISH